jgi:hypothetical protein
MNMSIVSYKLFKQYININTGMWIEYMIKISNIINVDKAKVYLKEIILDNHFRISSDFERFQMFSYIVANK